MVFHYKIHEYRRQVNGFMCANVTESGGVTPPLRGGATGRSVDDRDREVAPTRANEEEMMHFR